VFKGIEKDTKKDVAIKKIKMDSKDEGIPSTAIREISILKHLEFPNILKINEYILTKNELYMIFDFEESDLKR
jgi:serine/threonine protein kinase